MHPENVVQNLSNKTFPLFTGGQQFCEKIRLIAMSVYIGGPPFIASGSLTNKMIGDTLIFLLQNVESGVEVLASTD
jgi:hypothetical protein